ncbi:hypothetical protein FCV62_12260 [Vibrio kanaloae]|uniref:hypothetical protein n=1 Tax=Vibrio kanaloae TaxID=170673 RepID=UPI0010BE558A|nr:hypothetical protein [Vibrio kanaloae]TKF78452.1 hypothetical protein FCV62_12260 [Vibrio kanaloae]
MMQRYWKPSFDVNIKQDYIFYTQFNIKLPYLTKKFDVGIDEYQAWLDDDFDLEHVQRLSVVFGLNICRRHCDSEELMCSLVQYGDPRDVEYITPIQIHYIDKSFSKSDAYQFTETLLIDLSHHGEALDDFDNFHVYRGIAGFDILVYFAQYITVVIVPEVITNKLKTHSDCLTSWPHTWIEASNPLESDIPTVWKSYLTRIRQCVSRRLEATPLEFEIANWCNRQLER